MSNELFPSLPGRAWNRRRSAEWSTTVKTSVSGREYRAANWSYPRYQYELNHDVLRQGASDAELEQLLGFVNRRRGSLDTFLFKDAWDNAVVDQGFGVGNGSRTKWQLSRAFGGVVEPVFGIVEAPVIRANGVVQVGATVSPAGAVTMATPPANGAVLTWTGPFYWRCRFTRDSAEFNEMMWGLHELQGLGFVTTREEA